MHFNRRSLRDTDCERVGSMLFTNECQGIEDEQFIAVGYIDGFGVHLHTSARDDGGEAWLNLTRPQCEELIGLLTKALEQSGA